MFDDYLQTQYTFDPRSNLEYRIAKYSLDGSYNGISDVFNGKLQLCSDASPRLNAAYVFGTYYTQSVSEPCCEKTGLRGFRPGPTQTGLYRHRRLLDA